MLWNIFWASCVALVLFWVHQSKFEHSAFTILNCSEEYCMIVTIWLWVWYCMRVFWLQYDSEYGTGGMMVTIWLLVWYCMGVRWLQYGVGWDKRSPNGDQPTNQPYGRSLYTGKCAPTVMDSAEWIAVHYLHYFGWVIWNDALWFCHLARFTFVWCYIVILLQCFGPSGAPRVGFVWFGLMARHGLVWYGMVVQYHAWCMVHGGAVQWIALEVQCFVT